MTFVDLLNRIGKAMAIAIIPSFVLVGSSYMFLHDFGEKFLGASEESAFWKGSLTLYAALVLITLLFMRGLSGVKRA
ncbi:MAG TPA: hypothetical protein VEA92_01795 [Candidatus Paceibacterota bacterium]|nr:hypothetical protein [Candidatus Paceibacterota bacterium]